MKPAKDTPGKIIVASKLSVATSQLETAIQLWFHSGDPVSIHTLAAAACDCFGVLGSFKGRISFHQQWLKTLSNRQRIMAKEPQNFFKHGYRFPSKKIHFATHYGELLMHDSCISFEHLVGDMRPLMELYMLRFVIENPRVLKPDVPLDDLLAAKGFKIDEVAPLSRPEFFKRVFPATSRS